MTARPYRGEYEIGVYEWDPDGGALVAICRNVAAFARWAGLTMAQAEKAIHYIWDGTHRGIFLGGRKYEVAFLHIPEIGW